MAGHTWGSSQSRLLAGIVGDGKTWAGLLGKRVKLFKPALLFALVMTYCTNSPQGAEACFVCCSITFCARQMLKIYAEEWLLERTFRTRQVEFYD